MSITRTGKIGRLPKCIRDMLGKRIEDGEPGKEIVKWINGLSGVQRVLEEQFDGRPITEQNLSEWKQRGHPEWLRQEEKRSFISSLTEQAEDLDEAAVGEDIRDRLGTILTAELAARAVKVLEEVTDPEERWRQLQEILRAHRHLWHEAHNRQRIQLQRERWDQEVERQEEEDSERMKEESKSRMISLCHSPMKNELIAQGFGGGEYGKKMAEMIHRINFDLPLDDLIDTKLSGKTPPAAAKPNPTESKLIQANPT
jgi:hypothetical protein